MANFNYDSSKDQIDRQRALAQKLFSTPLPQGQMVPGGPNGFYAAPSKFASLAGLLGQLAGVYGMSKADDEQKGLDQKSMEAMTAALTETPWKDRAVSGQQQQEATAEMLRESRRGSGVDVGMMDGQPMGAESFPVAPQTPDNSQPLPQQANSLAAQLLNPAARVGTEVGRASNTAPAAPVQPAIDLGPANPATAGRKARMAAMLGTPANANAPAMPQIAPTAGASLAQQLAPTEPVQSVASGPAAMPAAGVPSVAPNGLTPEQQQIAALAQQRIAQGLPVSDSRMMTTQAADAAKPTQADSITQIMTLANSGPMGKTLANAKFQQLFATPEYDFKDVKNADGSTQLVGINKRNPTDIKPIMAGTGGNPENVMKGDKIALEVIPKIAETKQAIVDVQSQRAKAQRGIELMSQLAPGGGLLSALSGKVQQMFGAEAYTELDMLLKGLAFGDMKSAFGGNPTEGERKAQLEVKAAYERGEVPSKNALNTLIGGYGRKEKIHEAELGQYQGIFDQYRSKHEGTSGAAPTASVPEDWRQKWSPKR